MQSMNTVPTAVTLFAAKSAKSTLTKGREVEPVLLQLLFIIVIFAPGQGVDLPHELLQTVMFVVDGRAGDQCRRSDDAAGADEAVQFRSVRTSKGQSISFCGTFVIFPPPQFC